MPESQYQNLSRMRNQHAGDYPGLPGHEEEDRERGRRPIQRPRADAGWASFLYFLISGAEDLYSAIRFFSPAAGDQVITRRHLVLQPSNVGIGGRQFSRRQAFI